MLEMCQKDRNQIDGATDIKNLEQYSININNARNSL